MKKQVSKNHYFNQKYNTLDRFKSFWYQINIVSELKPNNILEIGIGNKIVTNILKNFDYKVTTVDIDKELEPDFVADITKLPFSNNAFDVVCAFEVLEHLPFEKSVKALEELKRVTNKHIIISIPDKRRYLYLCLKIPVFNKFETIIYLPNFPKKNHRFDGEHYWELNTGNCSMETFLNMLNKINLKIVDHYRTKENPYHHFFILKK